MAHGHSAGVKPGRVSELKGLWRRSRIARPDGTVDEATRVRWLQGTRTYMDLRQPAPMPDFAGVRVIGDLSISHCTWIASQEGFAGHLGFDGHHFEWARRIDFQPASPIADAGSLDWEDEVLIERGRDVRYTEHWHRDAAAATEPCGAVFLREAGLQTKAVLLRVGANFIFARDRAAPLPPGGTLGDWVAGAPTLQSARTLLDCEISFGAVAAEEFRITESTLPYRVGSVLGQHFLQHTVTTADIDCAGNAVVREWQIDECEGDAGALRPG